MDNFTEGKLEFLNKEGKVLLLTNILQDLKDDLKLFECIDLWQDDLSKLESALSIKQLVQLANLYGVTYDKILQNSKSNLEKQAKHCYDKRCTYTDEIMKQAQDNHK